MDGNTGQPQAALAKAAFFWRPRRRKRRGFTFMEILMVVILITVLAAFGIPVYDRLLQKGFERNAFMAVTTVHQANEIYLVKYQQYYPNSLASLAQINTAMNLNLSSADMSLSYTRFAGTPGTFNVDATWNKGGGAPVFTIRAIEGPLDLQGGTNPCCVGGCLLPLAACP